jgi:hypothetical protein
MLSLSKSITFLTSTHLSYEAEKLISSSAEIYDDWFDWFDEIKTSKAQFECAAS